MPDLLKCSLKSLTRKKLRTFLTIIGVAIGAFSIVTISNISNAGTQAITNELESLGLSGVSISSSNPSNNLTRLTSDQLDLIKNNKDVEYSTPLIIRNSSIRSKEDNLGALVWGINASAPKIASLDILEGRQIDNHDVNQAQNVCVIDQNLANKISGNKNILGKEISICCSGIYEEYKIIGITKVGNGIMQNMMGNYVPNFIYVPYTTMQNTFGESSFDQIAVKLNSHAETEQAGKLLVSTLSRSSGVTDGYISNSFSKQKEELNSLMNITTLIFSSVGGISLLVASISIMTVMMVSVNERKREIGIKKSLGATRKTILLEFLTESIIISIIGCILGMTIGTLSCLAFSKYFGFQFSISLQSILSITIMSIVSSAVFGIYPAIKASMLQPAEAFKFD